jgi:hypothetical protein
MGHESAGRSVGVNNASHGGGIEKSVNAACPTNGDRKKSTESRARCIKDIQKGALVFFHHPGRYFIHPPRHLTQRIPTSKGEWDSRNIVRHCVRTHVPSSSSTATPASHPLNSVPFSPSPLVIISAYRSDESSHETASRSVIREF